MTHPLSVAVCSGKSCSARHSSYIQKRLEADTDFYGYGELVQITSCLCQGRCEQGPTVVYSGDVQIRQNPIKASELLRKKVEEYKKNLHKR